MQKNETWLQSEEFAYPYGGMHRRGRAVYPDGKIRSVRAGIPDTYFSIPASGRVKGKYVKGWLTKNEQGQWMFNVPDREEFNKLVGSVLVARWESESETFWLNLYKTGDEYHIDSYLVDSIRVALGKISEQQAISACEKLIADNGMDKGAPYPYVRRIFGA